MKRFLSLFLLAAPLLAQVSLPSNQSRVAGRFVAWNYGGWSLQLYKAPAGTGSQTFSVTTASVQLGDGRQIMPFATNAPLRVGNETVTVSAVGANCVLSWGAPGYCVLTATFSNKHTTADAVSSGTFGLQEALNDAGASGGGAVTVDSTWASAGGTSGMISAATLPSNTGIEDTRTGAPAAAGVNGVPITPSSVTAGATVPLPPGSPCNVNSIWGSNLKQISPQMCGAKGDGTGNDEPAIVAAMLAASNLRACAVLPPGYYRVTTPIPITSGNCLIGEYSDRWATAIRPDGVTAFSIVGTSLSFDAEWALRNFMIWPISAPATATCDGNTVKCMIDIVYTDSADIEDVNIYDQLGADTIGISIDGTNYDDTFTNMQQFNSATRSTQIGIRVSGASFVTLKTPDEEGYATGIQVNGTSVVDIHGGYHEGNAVYFDDETTSGGGGRIIMHGGVVRAVSGEQYYKTLTPIGNLSIFGASFSGTTTPSTGSPFIVSGATGIPNTGAASLGLKDNFQTTDYTLQITDGFVDLNSATTFTLPGFGYSVGPYFVYNSSAYPIAIAIGSGAYGGHLPSEIMPNTGITIYGEYFASTTYWFPASSTLETLPNLLYSAAGTPLWTCAAASKGAQAVVSDAATPTYNATYASGGAVTVPVICDGANWKTH